MKNRDISVHVLAGGIGSRFWPKSRSKMPKQFIDILGIGKSLLQMTVERFLPLINSEKINIITSNGYKHLVISQLYSISEENILCEPLRKNTAACIAYAAFKEFKRNPNSVMVIVPSDHLILDQNTFLDKINYSVEFAINNEAIVTLGIPPTRPDTGYGYIHYNKAEGLTSKEMFKIISFKEKPKSELAKEYFESGDYLWNAGIFIAKASTILKSFEQYSLEIFDLFNSAKSFFNTEKEVHMIEKIYKEAPETSFDFAVLEKAKNLYVINANIGWSDLGTWESLYQISDNKDLNDNFICGANVRVYDTSDCVINVSDNRLLITKGLKDFIIVDSNDVTLIYPRSEEQKIKEIYNELDTTKLSKFI